MAQTHCTTILFLASEPSNAARLRVGQELRDIQERLQLARMREQYSLVQKTAVRPHDITQAILDIDPSIIHFSGHGTSSGQLCFEDISGKLKAVSCEALSSLFELLSEQVTCVILNCCYSALQAKAIAEHINYVIGMKQEIGDEAAIVFATGFYKALGAGRSIKDAFNFGIVELQLLGIPEHLTPILFEQAREEQDSSINIDALVQEIREKVKPYIKERCGTIRVLDMTQSIDLNDIYTNVNILENITGRTRLEIAQLLQNFDPENFKWFRLSHVTQEKVLGLQALQQYRKLMVLGKPGSGKTTFLKYLAMQCIEGQFQGERLPIFITLKEFAETPEQLGIKPEQLGIKKYIALKLSKYKVKDASVKAKQVLEQGKVLVFLDGLDEVREEDTKRVLKQIQEFSDQFHTNQFVITCRIAANEYTFQGFTEVEVADFDKEQITIFAQNWFRLSNLAKSERFIEKLKENEPIQELATNPLLLTLLCLVFDEVGNFPANRSELYEEGVDVLLKKWDAKRNIERDLVYKNLSLQRKEDLLSQIALITFKQKDYFFKQKTVEGYIADFISNLRNASTETDELKKDSEAILKSIEAQHGLLVERAKSLYSFSHLTFQEYFAAREIKERSALESLVEHITERRWREVFLLTTNMMRKADDLVLLMKYKIDELIAQDEKLQEFLRWVYQKAQLCKTSYKAAVVRAFYLNVDLDLDPDRLLGCSIDIHSTCVLACAALLSRALKKPDLINTITITTAQNIVKFDSNFSLESKPSVAIALARSCAVAHILDDSTIDTMLKEKIQKIKEVINSTVLHGNIEESSNWYFHLSKQQNEIDYIVSILLIQYKFGNNWQFSVQQKTLLKQYYFANQLLVDCLNSDCYVSHEVRQEIEDTLLLPATEK